MNADERADQPALLKKLSEDFSTIQQRLAAPEAADLTVVAPLSDQITSVQALTTTLIAHITALSDGTAAERPTGEHVLPALADAVAHATEATSHLGIALAAATDAHRLRHNADFYSQHIRLPEIPDHITAAHTAAIDGLGAGQERLATAAEWISTCCLQQHHPAADTSASHRPRVTRHRHSFLPAPAPRSR